MLDGFFIELNWHDRVLSHVCQISHQVAGLLIKQDSAAFPGWVLYCGGYRLQYHCIY